MVQLINSLYPPSSSTYCNSIACLQLYSGITVIAQNIIGRLFGRNLRLQTDNGIKVKCPRASSANCLKPLIMLSYVMTQASFTHFYFAISTMDDNALVSYYHRICVDPICIAIDKLKCKQEITKQNRCRVTRSENYLGFLIMSFR